MRPITFRILCAMATAELRREPSMTDGEWKARVKDRLVHQGYSYPADLEMLVRALNAANAWYEKQHGPRPIPGTVPPRPKVRRTDAPNLDPPWPRRPNEGRQSLHELVTKLITSGAGSVKPGAPDED